MVLTSILALDITNVNSVYLQENESNCNRIAIKQLEDIYDEIIEGLPENMKDRYRGIWTIATGTQQYRNSKSCLMSR